MKSLSLTILISLMLIVSYTTIKKYLNLNLIKNTKDEPKTLLKETFTLLNECFDLENKNKRSIHQSIELVEYCLDKYGDKKWY